MIDSIIAPFRVQPVVRWLKSYRAEKYVEFQETLEYGEDGVIVVAALWDETSHSQCAFVMMGDEYFAIGSVAPVTRFYPNFRKVDFSIATTISGTSVDAKTVLPQYIHTRQRGYLAEKEFSNYSPGAPHHRAVAFNAATAYTHFENGPKFSIGYRVNLSSETGIGVIYTRDVPQSLRRPNAPQPIEARSIYGHSLRRTRG